MLDLFRAEWLKIAGNRWAVMPFIWIFPLGTLLLVVFITVLALLSADVRAGLEITGVQPWNVALVETWAIINNPLGRGVLAAFTAIIFAGEYQNDTWKNLVPRRARIPLIVNKFVTLGVFVVVSFTLMGVINAIGQGLLALIVGVPFGTFDAETVRSFLVDYANNAILAFGLTLTTAGYAALIAIATRNTLVSVMGTILLVTAETTIVIVIFIIYGWFDLNLAPLYQLTPGYNLLNILQHTSAGDGSPIVLNQGVERVVLAQPLSAELSLALILIWGVAFIGLTAYAFSRQDLT
jgi:ABC-type transport system involved in multi-copper enzyme maturation permease subunit